MSNVVFLHKPPQPVEHYLRVGVSGHRQLETLLEAGEVPIRSFVLEASSVADQRDLISLLRQRGRELVLDTKVAELSSVGKFDGSAKHAPWADQSAPLGVQVFSDLKKLREMTSLIARFAVRNHFNAVLAPTHLIAGSDDPTLALDVRACGELRAALDREGGRHIGIDYNLIWSYQSLRDVEERKGIIAKIRDADFDNLWIRTSGIESAMTGVAARRYTEAANDLLEIGRPLVADQLAGLGGLAAVVFGPIGGLCHGVCEKERFNASDWAKPRETESGGGSQRRVLITSIDKMLTTEQVELIMSAPHARRVLSCGDRNCCPKGLDDMLKQPKRHYVRQRVAQVADISKVPEAMRVAHFRSHHLAVAVRLANQSAKLRVANEGIKNALTKNADRVERMQEVVDRMVDEGLALQQSPPPVTRSAPKAPGLRGGV
jgi:hypothetical protein